MFTMIFILNRLIQDFRGIKSEDFILNDTKFYFVFLKIIKNYFEFYFNYFEFYFYKKIKTLNN